MDINSETVKILSATISQHLLQVTIAVKIFVTF